MAVFGASVSAASTGGFDEAIGGASGINVEPAFVGGTPAGDDSSGEIETDLGIAGVLQGGRVEPVAAESEVAEPQAAEPEVAKTEVAGEVVEAVEAEQVETQNQSLSNPSAADAALLQSLIEGAAAEAEAEEAAAEAAALAEAEAQAAEAQARELALVGASAGERAAIRSAELGQPATEAQAQAAWDEGYAIGGGQNLSSFHNTILPCESGSQVNRDSVVGATDDWGRAQINRPVWRTTFADLTGIVFEEGVIQPVLNGYMAAYIEDVQGLTAWTCWRNR